MLDATYLDAIKQSEGFAAQARWDYAQNTNGYGTRARFSGEVIDKAEADKRFADEIKKAADFVEKFAPGLDEGSKAALTSLTYNAGTAWTQSGLGEAVAQGDLQKAQSIFLNYNKAGGEVQGGLVQRRLQEVAWFGQGAAGLGGMGAMQQVASAATEAAASSITSASAFSGSDLVPLQADVANQGLLIQASGSASSPNSYASSRDGKTEPQAFSSLGGDAVLLSLLSYMTKTAAMKDADGEANKTPAPVQSA